MVDTTRSAAALTRPGIAPTRTRYRLAARMAAPLLASLLLSGCGITDWFSGEEDGPKLGGNRISVLQLQQQLEVDPQVSAAEVTLPAATVNADWAQAGGNPAHNPGHVALGNNLSRAWSTSVSGSSSSARLLAGPVVAGGRLFVLDTDYDLHAFDARTGKRIWTRNILRENQDGEAFGGGVAVHENRIYATNGFGEAVALDYDSGNVIWRRRIAGPIRSAPTVLDNRVFVSTVDNQMITLSAENGALQWYHTGFLEPAALLGGSAPAVEGDTAIVPYSSGELFALRVENGRQSWQDSLAAVRRGENLTGLADIRGLPVIADGVAYAISHSGRMAAVDIRSGQRVWEQDVGGITTPAVIGDWVFVTTNDSQVVALTRRDGRVRWISQLQQWEDPEDKEDPVLWTGPIVAGGRLLLTNNQGELLELSVTDGKVIKTTELPAATLQAPVVAGETLYLLTEDGDLVAYR
ncbi:pyrrolo-quinoline quinone [Niveispirillum lacus]|uniref:Pyrrolo-quinoline quinone n=1 Tax=Niveispirillum lacus TaxID=1981099 RepID=A0A255YRV1_9PROT|nr:PQQ-like beta-propeller repeat protein [Niveispirillum lacus]OYQ31375.1 pyrrolo-quinoline quinone [Niveispirillum lacus]